ncbi:MAG: ATP-dependent DNA helicase RecG, partial [Bacteriovoracaceae bacterium]
MSSKTKKEKPPLKWESSLLDLSRTKKPTKTIQGLMNAGIKTLSDLLWVFPNSVETIPPPTSFDEFVPNEMAHGKGKIVSVRARPNFYRKGKRGTLLQNISLTVKDESSQGTIELKFFNCYPNQKKRFEGLEEISFYGKCSEYRGDLQIVAAEVFDKDGEVVDDDPTTKRNYPTISGISGTQTLKLIDKIPLPLWEEIPDIIEENYRKEHNFIPLKEALKSIHGLIEHDSKDVKNRIIFEELLVDQIKIEARKKMRKILPTETITFEKVDFEEATKLFPYELTQGQIKTIQEALEDLASGHPMMRLVQGDVGSGKTSVVLVLGDLLARKKYQTAIMCPTESLARQHYSTFQKLFKGSSRTIGLLVGSLKAKEKKEIYAKLEAGEIDIVIGTHALIQKDVHFKSLKLAVIDEQHKFGVNQRITLTEKGDGTHCLVMTATPIPRSLCMTQYGDLDVSVIAEKPKGRQVIQTRMVEEENFPKFLEFMKKHLDLNEQAYIVVPAIEESENFDFMYLEKVLERFKKFFPQYNVEGVHGKLKSQEKDDILKSFEKNEIQVIVATSVVEVGIDVPNSTIIAILSPERFGLSSLHQLRGRVGRGEKKSFCFLICDKSTPNSSKNKLKILELTDDGFRISEEDLKNRGRGDLFGTAQSGYTSRYQMANIVEHVDILYQIKNDFQKIVGPEFNLEDII